MIHPIEIIQHKRDGIPLQNAEIEAFIRAIVDPTLPNAPSDSQIAAFLMAVFFRGLSAEELAALTRAMRFSGETFDAAPLATFCVDKHSTGGVGDKTSLLIAPILAAAGLAHPTPAGVPGICVPMISGRSLGHTGGTLDKLETIPGFDTQLSMPRFLAVLRQCGAALIGQTPTLVPADRILYALRDHTGTVESPFLITASIMSKKLAESLNALVLDVKVGTGAFMPTYQKSRQLAELMVSTGNREGTRTVALLTQHDEPLGRFAGNWLEVRECVDILQNHRHPMSHDLIQLSLTLAGWMLHLAAHADTPEAGAQLADQYLTSGAAYRAWLNIVSTQGGDTSIFSATETSRAPFLAPRSFAISESANLGTSSQVSSRSEADGPASRTLLATTSGFLTITDCKQVGWAVQRLGAGRTTPGGPVSAAAGIEVHARQGDRITLGQPLVTLYADTERQLAEPCQMLQAAYTITPTPPTQHPQIREIITGAQ